MMLTVLNNNSRRQSAPVHC